MQITLEDAETGRGKWAGLEENFRGPKRNKKLMLEGRE